MIVFGSSIGASYRSPRVPTTWQRLPPSTLAPEASSVGWIGRRLVAWDYEGDTQDYSPSPTAGRPRPSIRSASASAIRRASPPQRVMFAWFCGQAATVGAKAGSWALASGGVTAPTVPYGGTRLKQFQTASLAPAGAVIALAATGLVVKHGGPCFGCKGSPVTYWAYRAQPAPSADRAPPMRPVRVVAPRGWATARELPGRLPTVRRHVHDHHSQAEKRGHHRVSRGGWPAHGGVRVPIGPPTRPAGRGRSKGSSAERRHGSGTCTSRSTLGRRRTSPSPSASGGTRRSRLTRIADAARAAF